MATAQKGTVPPRETEPWPLVKAPLPASTSPPIPHFLVWPQSNPGAILPCCLSQPLSNSIKALGFQKLCCVLAHGFRKPLGRRREESALSTPTAKFSHRRTALLTSTPFLPSLNPGTQERELCSEQREQIGQGRKGRHGPEPEGKDQGPGRP